MKYTIRKRATHNNQNRTEKRNTTNVNKHTLIYRDRSLFFPIVEKSTYQREQKKNTSYCVYVVLYFVIYSLIVVVVDDVYVCL